MRSPRLASVLLAAVCASAHASPVIESASNALLQRFPNAEVYVLGELHGTVESPALAATLTRRLLSEQPVTVTLEIPREEQPAIDAWLASDGADDARAALLGTPFWQVPRERSDGRRSAAMLELLDRLRVMKGQYPALDVIAFDTRRAPDMRSDAHLAESVRAIASRRADDRTVVLTGNYHAKRSAPSSVLVRGQPTAPPPPMLAYLPLAPAWVSVSVSARSGQFWACMPSCGVQDVRATAGATNVDEGVELLDASRDYDATLMLPRITAAEPVEYVP